MLRNFFLGENVQSCKDDRVTRTFGEPLKAYGQDRNSYKEGRRNFVEHREERAFIHELFVRRFDHFYKLN